MTWPASDPEQPDRDVRDPMDGNGPLERAEITDSDDLGSTDAGLDPLDDSWDPPDRPSRLISNPITPREERASSFDRQLAAEIPDPDPYAEAERNGSGSADGPDIYPDGPSGDSEFDDSGLDQVVESTDGAHRARTPTDHEAWRRTAEEDALHLDPRS